MRRRLRDGGSDKGWSWVVVFAACFSSLVLDGILRSSGVLLVPFTEAFGVNREEAPWPVDVCLAAISLAGPISGILGQYFGVRPVVIAGSLIGAVGLSTCFFSASFNVIICLFGVIFGVGYGLVSTLMPVIVNIYFFNLRSTAIGISISGACFGSAIFPAIIEYLIDNYEIYGCLLLLGGMVLNVAVAGALMRPPFLSKLKILLPESHPLVEKASLSINSYSLLTTERKISVSLNNFIDCSEKTDFDADLDPKSSPQRELQAELVQTLSKRIARQSSVVETFQEESYNSLDTSVSSFYGRRDDTIYKENDDLLKAQKEFEDTLSDFQSVVVDIEVTSKSDDVLNRFDPDEVKTSDLTESCPARHSFSVSSAKRKQLSRFKSPIPSAGPLKKHAFIDSSGDISTLDLYPVSESTKQETRKVSEAHSLPVSKNDRISESAEYLSQDFEEISFTSEIRKPYGISRSLIVVATSAAFYLTTVTSVSFYFLYHTFDNIILDYSVSHGISREDTKDVLLAFTACDLFGRLCLGWITDKKYLTRSRFVMFAMAAIGVVFFCFPFATDYWSLLVVSGCYGVLLGCTVIMFPILLVEYLGLEMHPVSYGCMCFPNAIFFINRPFLIGYLRNVLGSYENMFFFMGAISIVVATAWLLEKCFLRKNRPFIEERKNEDPYQPS